MPDVEKEFSNSPSNSQSFDQKHEEKSRGIQRVEIISSQYGRVGTFVVFFCIFLIAYCYGLDNTVRYNFQAFAQSSYGTHSLLSTVNTATAVIAVAAQPFYARLSDYFGRAELLCICIVFYAVGTILESQAKNVRIYAGGAVIYQFGYTGLMLLLQLLAGDFSLLNWRLLASFIPATPFIINTWISGNVVSSLGLEKWSWGIAMWAIIVPVACCPLLFCLAHMHWRAKRNGDMEVIKNIESEYSKRGLWGFIKFLFFKIDIIGIFLIVAILALILVPFSIAGGIDANWKTAKVLAPLIVGFCVIPFLFCGKDIPLILLFLFTLSRIVVFGRPFALVFLSTGSGICRATTCLLFFRLLLTSLPHLLPVSPRYTLSFLLSLVHCSAL